MIPVFMIGTQRSGSNLLRLMLNQLNELASPHPPHILERISPLMDLYGDLDKDENFNLLVDDVCRLVELNPVEWSDIKFDRELIKRQSRERSLMSVYGAVYDLYAASQNANSWCCKSLANIQYVDEIERYFDKPKYIYLYRDGRDVALSFKKAVVGEKHIYNIAKDWTDTQNIALDFRQSIDSDRFYSISYEALIAEPEKMARQLCDFLGADYVPEMLNFHKTSEAKNAANSSQLWGNVTNPIMKNNSKKYKTEMDERDLSIFESVSGDVLDKLGYERDIIMSGKELVFSESEIEIFNELNRAGKFDVLKSVNKEDKERRERQVRLLSEIKSRSVA